MLIPGTSFNENRDRLFFFWSQDILPRNDPGGLQNSTMPTLLERARRLLTDRGHQRQPHLDQGSAAGRPEPRVQREHRRAGMFPEQHHPRRPDQPDRPGDPGHVPEAHRHRSDRTAPVQLPVRGHQPNVSGSTRWLRVDWNVRPGTTTFYSRLQFGHEVCARGFITAGCPAICSCRATGRRCATPTTSTPSARRTRSCTRSTPTTVLEATVGLNYSAQKVYALSQADLDAVNRRWSLPGLNQFFPEANPFNLIPNFSVGGTNALPNTRAIGNFEGRYPFDAQQPDLGHHREPHETAWIAQPEGGHLHRARACGRRDDQSSFNGTLNFNANASNPFDTNFGFANALLGSVNSYHGVDVAPLRRRPIQPDRVLRPGQLARDAAGSRSTSACASSTSERPTSPARTSAYFDPAAVGSRPNAPKLYEPVCPGNAATCSGTAPHRPQSAHR